MAAMPAAAKCAVTRHLEVTCLLACIILDLSPDVLSVVDHGGYARSSQVRCDQPFGSDLFTGVDNPGPGSKRCYICKKGDKTVELTFCGAARQVTGSMFLLQAGGFNILIDCGLSQGEDEKVIGDVFPFRPTSIDYVLLTHAHIDHSGRLPQLVKEGFRGTIYATKATSQLCSIMLLDSAHIQESEAEWKSRKNKRSGKPPVEPLYTQDDAYEALELFQGVAYDEMLTLSEDIHVRFTDAGHLLGSATIEVFACEDGVTRKIVFSGDIGNLDQPIIKDPDYVESADIVVMESTYGDRLHSGDKPSLMERAKMLADITSRTFKRGGKLIIPSFAVGRTQELLYLFRLIYDHKLLDFDVPVFLDSPLAVKATSIFRSSIRGDYFDDEAMKIVKAGGNPVDFPGLVKTQDVNDSIALNSREEPCVIISSSGMCDAGRIKHHLKHNLWKKECTVLFVGYQAVGTLGRNIVDGAQHVTIFGEQIDVRAEITSLPGLSGHADRNGLLTWLHAISKRPEKVFVVHGDENVAPLFAQDLAEEGYAAVAPKLMDSYDLAAPLPEMEKAVFIDRNRKTLDGAFKRLEDQKDRLVRVLERFQQASSTIDFSDQKRCTRLANAISRFASDLDDLADKWNSDV